MKMMISKKMLADSLSAVVIHFLFGDNREQQDPCPTNNN